MRRKKPKTEGDVLAPSRWQGDVYHAFIGDQLKREYERRADISTRVKGLVSSSGVFVTLATAGVTLAIGRNEVLPEGVASGVIYAIGGVFLASVIGLVAGADVKYAVASSDTLSSMVDEHWSDHEVDSRNVVAFLQVQTIVTLRRGNNTKARLLIFALVVQLCSLVGLVLALSQLWTDGGGVWLP